MSLLKRPDMRSFVECGRCAAKTGPPTLCNACSHNKYAIELLTEDVTTLRDIVAGLRAEMEKPVRMLLCCPSCGKRHIDEGEFAQKVHHTHACQFCGMVWRPALVATVGVQFLPGFKNGAP